MTPSTHVKVVKSYDATCIISNRTRATYWILENAAKIIQGFHMGHSFFGELEVHQRILKIPKKCIQSPLLLLCNVKALHIKYFQERLGKLSILWSQIILGKVRKQTSENVPLCLLSVDLPTYGNRLTQTVNPHSWSHQTPLLHLPLWKMVEPKISRLNFANLAYTKTNWRFNTSVEVKDPASNYQAPDHFIHY